MSQSLLNVIRNYLVHLVSDKLTANQISDIWLVTFFWMMVSMVLFHSIAALIFCWNFRRVKRWPFIVLIFNLAAFLITAYTGTITALLIALVCNKGVYEPQVGLIMTIGIGLSCFYVVLSVLRLMPTMA